MYVGQKSGLRLPMLVGYICTLLNTAQTVTQCQFNIIQLVVNVTLHIFKKLHKKQLPFHLSAQHVKNCNTMMQCDECDAWSVCYKEAESVD